MSAPRRRLLALAALVAAGALSTAANGDEPPPPAGTEPAAGIPPFVPEPGSAAGPALAAWTLRMVQAGRAAKGTRRAAELLYSAAAAQAADPSALGGAGRTYYEAWASAPADDPMGVFGALATFRIAVALGRFPPAQPFVAWLEAYERRYVPGADDPLAAQRFALLRRELAAGFQVDVATLLAGLGDHAGAAARLERVAEANPPGIGRLAPLWDRAAVQRFRAGQTEEARADVRRALAAEPDPELRARLTFWDLHLRHGLLTAEGDLRPTGTWPGPAYLEDLEPVLRDLHGNPHLGTLLLSAASSALLARADAEALILYGLAIADPSLARLARGDASVWGAFLPAVTVATRLKRFDEAEALLAEIERLAGEPVPLADALRARVKLARAEAAREPVEGAGTGAHADEGAHPPRAPPEHLPPAPPAEVQHRSKTAADGGAEPSGGFALPVLAAVAVLGLLVVLFLRRRR